MRQSILFNFVISLLVLFAFSACENKSESPSMTESALPPVQSATKNEPAHSCTVVNPGSHDDWCAGHQVPESLCTRCNASLIPAFKATGDWCQEHGLPESQCLICDPDLKIERPPHSSEAKP